MSLEDALNRHADIMEKLIATNEKIIGMAAARQGAATTTAPASDDKPKTTRTKKDDKKDDTKGDGAVTKADLVAKLQTWLKEFGDNKDAHPECAARYTLLKDTLPKVGGEGFTLKDLAADDQEKIDKLNNWFETKVKTVDKGHGIGRLVADPEPAGDEGGDDDLGV